MKLILRYILMLALGWFFYVIPTRGGMPASVKLEYNSHFACQDWEGYCIPNVFYPEEQPWGACGEGGFNARGECGQDSGPLLNIWEYLYYPSNGGVYKIGFANLGTCRTARNRTITLGHPPLRRFKNMSGDVSTNCIFEGNAYE